MARCIICKKTIHFWQKKVQSPDETYLAHEKCKPEGFTGEWNRDWEQ